MADTIEDEVGFILFAAPFFFSKNKKTFRFA
jgi:hypothetical protein